MKNIGWIILSLGLVALGVVALLPVMMAPMMFDAPGSDQNPFVWAFAGSVAVFPLSCWLAAGLPWLFWRRRFARWVFLLPLLNIAFAAAAMSAIGSFCHGNFAC